MSKQKLMVLFNDDLLPFHKLPDVNRRLTEEIIIRLFSDASWYICVLKVDSCLPDQQFIVYLHHIQRI